MIRLAVGVPLSMPAVFPLSHLGWPGNGKTRWKSYLKKCERFLALPRGIGKLTYNWVVNQSLYIGNACLSKWMGWAVLYFAYNRNIRGTSSVIIVPHIEIWNVSQLATPPIILSSIMSNSLLLTSRCPKGQRHTSDAWLFYMARKLQEYSCVLNQESYSNYLIAWSILPKSLWKYLLLSQWEEGGF